MSNQRLVNCRHTENSIIAFPNAPEKRKIFLRNEMEVAKLYVDCFCVDKSVALKKLKKEAKGYLKSLEVRDRENIYLVSNNSRLAFQYRKTCFGKTETRTYSILRHGIKEAFRMALTKT